MLQCSTLDDGQLSSNIQRFIIKSGRGVNINRSCTKGTRSTQCNTMLQCNTLDDGQLSSNIQRFIIKSGRGVNINRSCTKGTRSTQCNTMLQCSTQVMTATIKTLLKDFMLGRGNSLRCPLDRRLGEPQTLWRSEYS
jgi:hypothetical protein